MCGAEVTMFSGAHMIIYSKDADKDRAFLRDVLKFPSVDAGRGWLIFALPPAEVAVHPAERNGKHELYFMCDDLDATMADLTGRGVRCSKVEHAGWGSMTSITLPGGGKVGVYQPRHPVAIRR
jgi:catechol 2,3-dioxygenase-like lactoylglutathione lyase family enzyme